MRRMTWPEFRATLVAVGRTRQEKNAMPTIEGGCLCGAVRYRSDAEPVMQVVCHCETCRKNSGSAFSMNVAVPQDRLPIQSGRPRRYGVPSGANDKAFFPRLCGDCCALLSIHCPRSRPTPFIQSSSLA